MNFRESPWSETDMQSLTIEYQWQTTYKTCDTTGWQKGHHESKIGTHKLVQIRVCTLRETTAQLHTVKLTGPNKQKKTYVYNKAVAT